MIEINNIRIPIIREGGDIYYPISYLSEKVLKLTVSLLNNKRKKKFEGFLKLITIDFTYLDAGTQLTRCISEVGLRKLLKDNSIKLGRWSDESKKALNKLLEYLGEDLIDDRPRFKEKIKEEDIEDYAKIEKDVIKKVEQKTKKWQKCAKCGKYYPHTKEFFSYDWNMENNLTSVCKKCLGISSFSDETEKYFHNKYSEEGYLKYKNKDYIGLYDLYIKYQDKKIHKLLDSKEIYKIIIKNLFEKGIIHKNNLNLKFIKGNCKLTYVGKYFNVEELYKMFFGNHHREYPWHYKKYVLGKLSFEEARKIFNNYLEENNIEIKNIFEFNYYEIIYSAKLVTNIESDTLAFIMRYYDNKYPAYKFKGGYMNYWKKREHRIQALKYLVEEDMKLVIEKIPLYLTLTRLSRNYGVMYRVLKKYYKNLFYWVNEVYPDRFLETDFDVNAIRDEFDSKEEEQIDGILRKYFDNVVYNNRNSKNTVKIMGMEPDWLVFTEDGCYLVEYFGLYVIRNDSKRVIEYREKTKNKIRKYKELNGYKSLYLFPNDLRDNFKILYKKLKRIG